MHPVRMASFEFISHPPVLSSLGYSWEKALGSPNSSTWREPTSKMERNFLQRDVVECLQSERDEV